MTKASPVKRDADNGHFTGPFVMAAFNTRIVARSASLLHYGNGFRYAEYSDYGAGPVGALTAVGSRWPSASGWPGSPSARPGRCSTACCRSPGEGPSDEAQDKGRLRMEVTAQATNGARYRTTVAAPYDPGYSGTAVMFGQAALSLVEDGDELPDAAGVLTPASALGAPLVERLRSHRFTLETERLPG